MMWVQLLDLVHRHWHGLTLRGRYFAPYFCDSRHLALLALARGFGL